MWNRSNANCIITITGHAVVTELNEAEEREREREGERKGEEGCDQVV